MEKLFDMLSSDVDIQEEAERDSKEEILLQFRMTEELINLRNFLFTEVIFRLRT